MAVMLKVVEKNIGEICVKNDLQEIKNSKSNIANSRRGYFMDDRGRIVFNFDMMEDGRGQEMYITEELETGKVIAYPVRRGCFAEQERGRYQRAEYVLTKYTSVQTEYVEKDVTGREVFLFDEEVSKYVIKDHKGYKSGHRFILINKKVPVLKEVDFENKTLKKSKDMRLSKEGAK